MGRVASIFAALAGALATALALRLLAEDRTLALLREGYPFILRRCQRLGTDVFETRLAGRRAICVTGEEAARMFYEPGRFTRVGSMPQTTLRLLQDKGSVQQLDGAAHRRRKGMLLSVMGPGDARRLADTMERRLRSRVGAWERAGSIALHDAMREVLCATACEWTGVPLPEPEVRRRTREFAAMIDGAGTVGPKNWWGLVLRRRTERWARGLVREVRQGVLPALEESPIRVIAEYREANGCKLTEEVAAVELLNVLRPTVAVARYVTYAALALHEYPECRKKARADDEYLEWFVHEVRRFYPFFPFVGGRVRTPFRWRGRPFGEGKWVLLDLYGTNRDPRTWGDPEAFRPERFRGRDVGAFELVPQGGGDHHAGHRCAGEWVTIELTKRATRLLAASMDYDIPPQDLGVRLSWMPAAPKSGFVISDVRRTGL